MNKKDIDYSLYLVTNQDIVKKQSFFTAIKEAIKGGVTLVQLREKSLDDEEFYALAIKVKKITDSYDIPLIINDNINLAKKIDCAGVHIGQDDEKLQKAREVLGKDKIVGVSVGNELEVKEAIKNGADYLGIGTIFFTSTKKDIKRPIGLDGLEKLVKLSTIPKVAIGGINRENLADVIKCGVDGVAVISAILSSDDIKKTSSQFLKIIKGYK